MIEWVLILIVVGLLLWVIEWIIRYAWCYFKWCVLGWKPDIYDADIVENVCERYFENMLETEMERRQAQDIEPPSCSEIEEAKDRMRDYCRNIIEGYCIEFKWSGRSKKASAKNS